jgi:hypothetical protein
LLFDRAKSADSLVEAHQVLAEFLEPMELGDLVLRLAQRSRIGEGFSQALASDSTGQTELRVVTGIVGFAAMAGWLTAATHYGCDRNAAKKEKPPVRNSHVAHPMEIVDYHVYRIRYILSAGSERNWGSKEIYV